MGVEGRWVGGNDSNVAPGGAKIYACCSIYWGLSIRGLERRF